jgi:hypothetical protein
MERSLESAADLPAGSFDAAAFRAVAHSAGMQVVGGPLAEGERRVQQTTAQAAPPNQPLRASILPDLPQGSETTS